MEAARTTFEGEMNEKIKAILTPEQAVRLRQLDLQRRGVMSLADPKVAEQVKLSPQRRAEIAKIVADWQQTMRAAFDATRESGQFPDMERRLSPTRQKLDKDKKAAETKVEAVLSDQERAAWQAALGEPFTFRADPPRPRPNFGPGGRGGPGGPGGPPPGPPGGPGGPDDEI